MTEEQKQQMADALRQILAEAEAGQVVAVAWVARRPPI